MQAFIFLIAIKILTYELRGISPTNYQTEP